jgi:hypothetical protein
VYHTEDPVSTAPRGMSRSGVERLPCYRQLSVDRLLFLLSMYRGSDLTSATIDAS